MEFIAETIVPAASTVFDSLSSAVINAVGDLQNVVASAAGNALSDGVAHASNSARHWASNVYDGWRGAHLPHGSISRLYHRLHLDTDYIVNPVDTDFAPNTWHPIGLFTYIGQGYGGGQRLGDRVDILDAHVRLRYGVKTLPAARVSEQHHTITLQWVWISTSLYDDLKAQYDVDPTTGFVDLFENQGGVSFQPPNVDWAKQCIFVHRTQGTFWPSTETGTNVCGGAKYLEDNIHLGFRSTFLSASPSSPSDVSGGALALLVAGDSDLAGHASFADFYVKGTVTVHFSDS